MNDPVKGCDVYKDIGCTHVDGFLCDYPNCSILKGYKMNERINELFGQALDQAVPETWTTLTPAQLSKLKEKFAELIVRECADFVQFYYKDHACEGIAHDMKTHFGVE
jgi:hypothetical protein